MSAVTLGPLAQVSRTVRDIKESEAWYGTTLGLPHLYTFGSMAFLDCGGTRLYLSATEQPGPEREARRRSARRSAGDLRVVAAGEDERGNDALTIVSYEMTPDHFSMQANGQTYNSKFDGKEYPIEGDPGHTMVSLKRIDADTVVETDRRQGKITDEIRLAAAKDGKTIKLTDKDPSHGQTTTITLDTR